MTWWPVAFALQRIEDKRALPALLALAGDSNPYTRAFAVKGLGALKDRTAVPVILPLLSSRDRASPSKRSARSGRSAIRPPRNRCCGSCRAAAPLTDEA